MKTLTLNPAFAGIRGKTAQGGFTLVEIAIVLVIIGLLLGGILKGQEMITQAKIKNVVNDFNGITAAVNSYQDRYRALPGDDIQAATRWAGNVAGNGNGQIAGLYNNVLAAVAVAAEESNLFWWHLRQAGFVAGATSGISAGQQPNNAVNGMMGVETGASGTSGLGFVSVIMCSSNLPDKIAISVDTQLDDGAPNAGQVRAQLQTAPNPNTAATSGVSAYAENGTNQYLLCKNL
jgi:prepilin-type N-terminal cleavage/methylation domain-containing protein